MNFSEALNQVKDGWVVTRPSWENLSLGLHKPEKLDKIQIGILFIYNGDQIVTTYSATQEDLLAEDFDAVEFRS